MHKVLRTILLIFLFCEIIFAGNEPSWVAKRPVSKDFYIGIASASKKDYPDKYRQIAKDEALHDLASEIQVNISGEFIHEVAEQGGMLDDELRSLVKSKTQANLEGYDLVENWENKSQYWVYYRLSKKKYQDNKNSRKKEVTDLGRDFFIKAKKSEDKKDITSAVRYYIQALGALDEFIGEPLQIEYNGQKLYLQNSLFSSIQNNLSNIKLKALSPMVKAKKGLALSKPLEVKVLYVEGQKEFPVANLPLNFFFVRGKGQLLSNVTSDRKGIAACTVSEITSDDKNQIINVKLDMAELTKGHQAPLQNLTIPETRFILSISALTAYIESHEENMGKELSMLKIEPKLKEALGEKGFSFMNDVSQADFLIKIEARTWEAVSLLSTTMVKAEVNVSVMNLRTGEEVYKDGFSTFPGVGFKSDQAGMAALDFAARKMKDTAEKIAEKTIK